MADALISVILKEFASITRQETEQEVRLVVGVKQEVEKLTSNLRTIKAVLNDAEKRQVKEEAVEVWLDKLKDTSYDMDDVLDEWNTELSKLQIEGIDNALAPKKKVCSFIPSTCSCFSDQFNKLVLRRDIAYKIKELNKTLDEIAKERQMYGFELNRGSEEIERPKTTSLVDLSSIIGRGNDKVDLVNNLLGRGSLEERSPHVISLVGMGGIGKTTLAQLAYNNDEVKAHFEIRMWVCVSDPFDQIKVAKAIIQEAKRDSTNITELQTLLQIICNLIGGKKFFLVLDDVWSEKEWEPFKHALSHGAQGSRILVTTRKVEVAEIMDSAPKFILGTLFDEDCWSIFSNIAFFGKVRNDVEQRKILEDEDVRREITIKCKGLPLAAKTLGSLMRFKKTLKQWQDVLQSRVWEFEKSQQDLFVPLLLSYFDLPSPVKRCFTYCAIFPKDYKFDREKMVQNWMAQGYLVPEGNVEIETTGQEYFEMLAMRSFFQDFEKDEDGSITKCKMHDIVHDQAQLLMKNECFHREAKELETNSFYKKVRHLNLTFEDEEVPAFVYEAKKVRTLLIQFSHRSCNRKLVLPKLFCHLTSLRTLDLSNQLLEKVPKEVGQLIHLRCLNLYGDSDLKELPETLCDLYNLQILNVSFCQSLKKLPQGMGKLRNLRHFISYCVFFEKPFPKGFGRLISLITLSEFPVGSNDDSGECSLGELENLNNLRGELGITRIKGLENLREVCEGAEKAQLKKKIHLRKLKLIFSRDGEEENVRMVNDEVLLNALEPHPGLEGLRISFYRGTALFPNWLMSLIKLKSLTIDLCNNLECLPPLGRLPYLEALEIYGWGPQRLKKVGVEFLGIEDERLPSSSPSLEIFPNLKSLIFGGLTEWEEWEEWDGIGEEENNSGVTIMPRLHKLVISLCPELKALPRFLLKTPLNELHIYDCLSSYYKTGEDWPKISHIPNIQIDNEYVQRNGC